MVSSGLKMQGAGLCMSNDNETLLIIHTVDENIMGEKITLIVINNASSIFTKRKHDSGWILVRITYKMDLTLIVQSLFQLD